MNIEKIHKLAADISAENVKKKITNEFQNVISDLQNIITQPNQGQHQTSLTTHLNSLYNHLEKSIVNDLSPAWYQILVELEIDDVFGLSLKTIIQDIFSKNTITPASAKEQLDIIFNKLNNAITAFNNISNGLKALNIGKDELSGDECEIGILIPREFIDNNLENFKVEIGEINFILNIFSEFFTGKKRTFTLRTLSTTDPLITVGTVVAIAAGLAKAVGFIIDNYKKLLEIKKLKLELKNQGLSDDNLQGIEDYCNDYMSKQIDKLVDELKSNYHAIKDGKRRNEILNGINIALNKIANRIDNGFNFEVRVNEPNDKNKENEEEDEELLISEAKLYEEIKTASKIMQFLKTEGEPILSLPEKKIINGA